MLTNSGNDGNGEEQRSGVQPEFRGIIVFTVPAVPLRCQVHLTTTSKVHDPKINLITRSPAVAAIADRTVHDALKITSITMLFHFGSIINRMVT